MSKKIMYVDGAIRQKTKFLYFFSLDHVPIWRRFVVTAQKRKLVAVATSLENSKIEVQIVHYSHSGTER